MNKKEKYDYDPWDSNDEELDEEWDSDEVEYKDLCDEIEVDYRKAK